MPTALLYARVSTQDQADNGFSLAHQKAVLELYCQQKKFDILAEFREDHSAKDFNRPEWKRLLLYVKANKKNIDAILFTRWDRFSRNTEEAYRVIREFKNMGIEVNAIEQPLDTSQPDSKVMLGIYLILPEVENDKTSIRTREGMRRAMLDGCFTGAAPRGYLHHRTEDGKSTLKPDPALAPIIRKVFREYATGIYSTEEIRKKYYNKGLKVSKNTLLNLLKNPVYCGKVVIKEWKKEDAAIVDGLHEAIIDTKTFETVQRIFAGKQVKPVHEPKLIDEILPLRGFLKCACGRLLTGSGSMGGGVQRHFYYHCNPPCRVRHKPDRVHDVLLHLLSEISLRDDAAQLYKEILGKTFRKQQADDQIEAKILRTQIGKLQTRLDSIQEKFFDDQIDLNTYNQFKKKTQAQIANLQAQISNLTIMQKDFESHLKNGISFLRDIDRIYTQAPVSLKKKMISALFPEKLYFEGTNFRTRRLDPVLRIILKKTKFKHLIIEESKEQIQGFKQLGTRGELSLG